MHSSSQKFTLPQRFFLHFYIVASIWTTFLLVATWCYAYTVVPPVRESSAYSTITSYLIGGSALRTDSTTMFQRHAVWQAVFLLLLMEAQVLRRLFETIYVFKYSPSARMHILGYLTGMFFYLAAPLSLCADCALDVFYFLVNLVTKFIVVGKDHMPPVEVELWQVVNPLIRLGWRHWIGAAVFFGVGFINKDAIRFLVRFEIQDKQRNMQFLTVIGLKLFPLHIISLKWLYTAVLWLPLEDPI
ncbi:hypothetical protein AAHE18_03G062600 [Arachis hypogaea]